MFFLFDVLDHTKVSLDKWQTITVACYAISVNGVVISLNKANKHSIDENCVLFMSISDVGLSVSVLVLAPLLFTGLIKTNHCYIELATKTLITLFGHLSLLFGAVMSYYRYACVKHLTICRSKIKRQFTNLTIVCVKSTTRVDHRRLLMSFSPCPRRFCMPS